MEVHHHPHVEKKNFKEYFLEFLMIFLAVTLGFFAENIRENISNHEKEINYMKGFVQDLKEDTTEMSHIFFKQYFLLNQMDSALSIPVERLNNANAQDSFYHHYVYFYSLLSEFIPYDNTLTQLRNAGGFSVIRQKDVLDSIGELNLYYLDLLKSDNDYYNTYYLRVTDAGAKVIKCPPFIVTINEDVKIPNDSEVFITGKLSLLQQLYSYINMEKGQLLQCLDREVIYRDKAVKLIGYINKKYRLE
ncbi:MAG TPA: hypothetical protein VN726_00770 [Hanamia sp.]|nr:hypothetical protein [Hanamia sp.]